MAMVEQVTRDVDGMYDCHRRRGRWHRHGRSRSCRGCSQTFGELGGTARSRLAAAAVPDGVVVRLGASGCGGSFWVANHTKNPRRGLPRSEAGRWNYGNEGSRSRVRGKSLVGKGRRPDTKNPRRDASGMIAAGSGWERCCMFDAD